MSAKQATITKSHASLTQKLPRSGLVQLIGGSCMIDADDSSSHYVTMYHHGIERFDDGKSDPFHIWRCAWNNPTTRTPMAIVTAVCVAPPPGREDRVGRITVTL